MPVRPSPPRGYGLRQGWQPVAWATTIAACACGDGGDGTSVFTHDSAGIRIVESRAPAWTPDAGWRLSTAPLLQIGTVEGESEYQFSEVAAAVRLDDGALVVADGGSQEIRFYGPDGRFLRATGGPGEAPGEYRLLIALGRGPADSLWVYDFGLRRFTVLTANGDPVRTASVGGTLSAVQPVGQLPDGSFVVKENWSTGSPDDLALGLVRNPVAVVRMPSNGGGHDTLAMLPGREVVITDEGGRAVMNAPLFARTGVAAIRGGDVVLGDQTEFEVRVVSATGALERVFRVPGRDLTLTGDDIARAIDVVVAREPEERRAATRARYAAMETPPTRPAYGELLVDREGNVWVSDYVRAPATPHAWTVFAADGRLLGDVEVPDRFSILEIGNDWILGVWRDALDVEYVRLYGLVKTR